MPSLAGLPTNTAVSQEIRNHKEFDNHEFLMVLTDEPSGLYSYIGIHNTNLGPALGGTRLLAYVSEEAALEDVLNLSRAMSYKCALANLPYGGGKGVIMLPNDFDRAQLLGAYARLVEKLGGLLKTGTDVGVSDEDVKQMAQFTSHMLGVTPADRGDLNTSKTAAMGVFRSIQATLEYMNGSSDFRGLRIAIKGVGKLGGELTRLTVEAGAQVFISDIDSQRSFELSQQYPGVEIVDNNTIHSQEVDIYAPCALGNEFTLERIAELNCKAVVGGANNQLAEEESGNEIHNRGIIYVPDYITNAGGLIYVADELEEGGFNKDRVLQRVDGLHETVLDVLTQAKSRELPTYKVADIIAQERIQKGKL